MYAKVYPLLRLPRRFGVFDYRIPDDMIIHVGDMIRVPFKNRSILAVVSALSEHTEVMSNIADVQGVTWPSALSADDTARLEHLALRIAQSPSSLYYHTFGTLTGETSAPRLWYARTTPLAFHKEVVETIREAINDSATFVSIQAPLEGACLLAQKLRERLTDQLLVLVPMEREAELIATTVPLGSNVAVLHGKTSPKERERVLRAWRNGTIRTLVGTRQASLIAAQKLGAVVVTSSGNDDHFNDRRNPRFDIRNAGRLQAAHHGARFFLVDALPRPEDMVMTERTIWGPTVQPSLVDLKRPEEYSDFPLVSVQLLAEIKTALQSQKKVLLSFNRKGVAKRAQCRACGNVLLCDHCHGMFVPREDGSLQCGRCLAVRTLPDHCPKCQDGKMGLKGIGNIHLEETLRTAFPGITIDRVEKGHKGTDAQIAIVTEYFFTSVVRPFAEKQYGLVAEVCIDLSQHADDFRSGEVMARKLHRLVRLAQQQGANCIVQTYLPDVIDAMRDGKTFMQAELAMRNAYGLPPAKALITVRHAEAAAITALTGIPFIDKQELMGCEGRIPADALEEHTARLSALPDTAVISIDTPYVHDDRLDLRKS